MRIYIIGNDGITLCREVPATVNDGEIAVTSKEELHAAPLNGKRLLALWNALPGAEKRRKVGDREALIDELWSAIEALPDPEPESDAKRSSSRTMSLRCCGDPRAQPSMRWRVPPAGSATPCAASFRVHSRRSSGSRLLPPKRNAGASTISMARQVYETGNQ